MPQLIVIVLSDAAREGDVSNVWLERGVPGITALDSYGLSHRHTNGIFDDIPLMPSLSDLLKPAENPSMTLFSVVPDGFDVDGLVAATEAVIGDLNQPNIGIVFTLPVNKIWGLRRK